MRLTNWLQRVLGRTNSSRLRRARAVNWCERLEARLVLTTINMAALVAGQGTTIFGADAGDRSGYSVSSAGDVNGDGFDDLLIGAPGADAAGNGKPSAGDSYVLFGGDFTAAVTHAGTAVSETLTGDAAANVIIGGLGNDSLIGNGGADVLRGGQGDDRLQISVLAFQRIVGGNGSDTLRLGGSGLSLNLTTLADNRLLGIEQIDLTGSGNNTLTLDLAEVLNLSDESNTLLVRGNAGDTVIQGTGWVQAANESIGSDQFAVFTQGAATLKVQEPPTVSPITVTVTVGQLAIDDVSGGAVDVLVTFSAASSEFVVGARTGGVVSHEFRVSSASVTAGLRATLGDGDDKLDLSGINLASTVLAGAGNDSITSGIGRDSLVGDDGDDTLNAGSGNDTVLAGAGRDSITGGAGADSISCGNDFDTVFGGTGNDTIDGGLGNDIISGQDGDDSIFGGGDNDKLTGAAGNDVLDGGLGDDVLNGDAGLDSLFGRDGADLLVGGTENDRLEGEAGADRLR